jgi:hypothetical protein
MENLNINRNSSNSKKDSIDEEVQRLLDSGTDIEVKADCDYTVLIFASSWCNILSVLSF